MWAGISTFRVGEWLIGVRSSTEELHDLLRRALAAHLVEGVEAPANYSVRAGGPVEKGSSRRELQFLYRSYIPVVRSRYAGPVVRGLLSYLSSHLETASRDLLRVHAVAVVSGDEAILAPTDLILDLARIAPWLEREGLAVVAAPHASLDAGSGELLVEAPVLEVDRSVLGELNQDRSGVEVEPGRYRLKGWAFDTGRPMGSMPPAVARAWALPALMDLPSMGVARAAQELDRLLDRMAPVGIALGEARTVARRLAEILAT